MIDNNIEKLVNEYAISISRLQLECDRSIFKYGRRELSNYTNDYNPFTNTNLNSMNTYNVLRTLYRWFYDIRSMRKDNREIHPIKNIEMSCNYLNDFSISPIFTFTDNDFINSICNINSKATFAFYTNTYKDLANNRKLFFINNESSNSSITNDFFSYSIQVNPLLYSYSCIDPYDGKYKTMDSDLFLELDLYNKIFKKDNYILKGNQYGTPLWLSVTNTNRISKEIKNYNINTGEVEILGYKNIYENEELLLKDNYTKDLLSIFQSGSRFYNFNNDRSFIMYDGLLELVFKKLKDVIDNDKENISHGSIIRKYNVLKKIIYEDEILRDGMEINGFPYNQYLALDTFKDNIYSIDNSEDIKDGLEELKDKVGDYIIDNYKDIYDDVFAKLIRLLPFIFSPAYIFKIQSPAMNIMYMTLTIMAIKNAYNSSNKRDYNKVMDNLYSILNRLDSISKEEVLELFNKVFDYSFLSNNIKNHISTVLKILIKNSSVKDISTYRYFNLDNYISKVENGNDIEDNILLDRAVILLTEFFNKCEDIRYFDASTFCIDIDTIKDSSERKSLRLFSESLIEACYIHLNTLGSEVFFNSSNINVSLQYRTSSNNLFRTNLYDYLLGLDKTRVSKSNVELYNLWNNSIDEFSINSYHSYISIINLYISLAYSIRITVDNLSINNYQIGISYDNLAMKRSQTIWSLTKIYNFHLMYMNNNSYGIYNDVIVSDNNKDYIEGIMVSQRYKLLLYGLHLRVWYNDGYLFYTNYKKLMNEYNGNINNVLVEIDKLYNYYPKENNLVPMNLFKNIDKNISFILPNIGLSLYPMSGSYILTSNAICLRYYINNNEMIVNLIHHGLKDIIVGDSLSSIIGDRLDCVRTLLHTNRISFNNLYGIFQKVYDLLGYSTYHEIALSSNLNYIYTNIIREHFLNNKNDCLLLSNTNESLYDSYFFENLNDKCSYELAYDNSWCYRIVRNILTSNDKNNFMKFIERYINLYRIACINFKAWHSKLNEDKLISKYYNNYYGLSLMNTIFIKDYKEGISSVIKDKSKYGIFNKILKRIYTGNVYNNPYSISNLFSISNSKISFEDMIVNFTSGGTIFGLYESPLLLMIYNNIDFKSGYIEPSLEQIYMLGRDIFGRIYSTMKRLYSDLNYNGLPIDKISKENTSFSIEDCKDKFINDSIDQFYIVTNNTDYNDNITKMYREIINKDDLYKFISIFGQFMDYDFITSQIIKLITNNQYSLTKKEDIVKYINNIISNSGRDIALFKSYCDSIDKIDNQLNSIINKMIERKQGSIISTIDIDNKRKEINKIVKDIEIKKEENHSNYPINIEYNTTTSITSIDKLLSLYISYDLIGMSKEEYDKLEEVKKQEIDTIKNNIEQLEIDYNKEISELEIRLSQLRRAKLIKEESSKEEVIYDTSSKEFYTMISKGKDPNEILYDKLVEINNNIISIKEIMLDNNYMLKKLMSSNNDDNSSKDTNEESNNTIDTIKNNEVVEVEEVKKEEDSITINTIDTTNTLIQRDNNLTIDSQIFTNKLEDYNYYTSLPDVIDTNEYALPNIPIENEDKSIIQFYSNLGERCTVIKDIRSDKEIDISIMKEHYKRNYYQVNNSTKPTNSKLSKIYNVMDNKEVSYNRYLYIPESYLVNYIPYYINPNSGISINKAILQEIPLYMNDMSNLLLVFYNIPISFNQRYEYIVKAINERIGIINSNLSTYIISKMIELKLDTNWNSNDTFTLENRINIIDNLYHSIYNN